MKTIEYLKKFWLVWLLLVLFIAEKILTIEDLSKFKEQVFSKNTLYVLLLFLITALIVRWGTKKFFGLGSSGDSAQEKDKDSQHSNLEKKLSWMQAMAERNFSLHRIWFRAKIHLISLVFFLFWFFASFAAYGVWGKNGFLIVFMSSFLVFAIVAMRIFYKKESSERVITQNIQKDILGDREDTD